ncbi:MAG: tetratricopeptide repeat protein [Proteobacteria bacterium]|nr:tetratricopeptide repeat protein [Pseudomonadota bacterium]MBU1641544.1 tetratricopeptide repeat protein [Pseudomonadota bacterium]
MRTTTVQSLFFVFVCIACLGISPGNSRAATAAKDLPLPVRLVLTKAGNLINQQEYDQAIEVLLAFQARGGVTTERDEADPKGYRHAEIDFALGTCYLFKNDYRPAAVALEAAVDKDPTHLSAWLNLARAAYELADYARAAVCFGRAYEAGHDPEHLYYSAVAAFMAQESEPSLTAFRRLLTDHPDSIKLEWRENFVQALLAADLAQEALPQIRRLATEFQGEKQLQWQEILLQEYLQLDMLQEALTYASWLTKEAPTRAKWWKALAHVNLMDGSVKPALTALTIYAYLTPITDQEARLLADLNLQVGIPLKAVPLYEEALRQKDDPRLLYNMMLALQQLGQAEQALTALSDFAPECDDPDLLMLQADLLYGLEQYRPAAQAYARRAEVQAQQQGQANERSAGVQSGQQGRAWLMAGYAALQANDVAASRKAFNQAANFEQQRKAAMQAMERLPKT